MKVPTSDDLAQATTPFTRAIAVELRRALAERGVTQVELARRTGIPRRNISLVAMGKLNVTITRLEVLFAALDYRLDLTAVDSTPAPRRSQKRAAAARNGG